MRALRSVERAAELLRASKFPEAVVELNKALATCPGHVDALVYRAAAYVTRARVQHALLWVVV